MFSRASLSRVSSTAATAAAAAAAAAFVSSRMLTTTPSSSAAPPAATMLRSDAFTDLTVASKTTVGKNTVVLRLAFPDATMVAGYDVASAVAVKARGRDGSDQEGKDVVRAYTPISLPSAVGYMDLLVKDYPGVGQASTWLNSRSVGDKVGVKGPFAKIPLAQLLAKKHVAMVAGGTGITPMLQVARAVLQANPTQGPQLLLVCGFRNEEEVLMREELLQLQRQNPSRVRVVLTLDGAPAAGAAAANTWCGLAGSCDTGRVSEPMLRRLLPSASLGDDVMVCVCGPPGFMDAVSGGKANKEQGEVSGILKTLGFGASQVFKF
jgi:cytochrome-b5 reductase